MIRNVLLAAAFAFVFCILTGCSSKSNSNNDTKVVPPQDSGEDKKIPGGKGRFPAPPPK
jgi:hypothetical protein